jgi:perosamine synthetase
MTLLSAPNISGNEWKYVKECLDTAWVSSVGAYVNQFEEMMADYTGCKYAVATSSGTTALHISLLLAGVARNDYVIVPNITFVASLNSVAYTGAFPLLIDVDEKTWQMDLELLESFLNLHTVVENNQCVYVKDKRVIRAIMPVHVLGNMVDMDRLIAMAEKYKLEIVEDATEALGSYYKGKHSGSFGLTGCFSFNGNKIITTGGGGMIVTNDEQIAKKAKHLTTQAKSDPFEYMHDEIGYNYRLVNILAAIGVAQMEQLPGFIERKKEIDRLYRQGLTGTGDIVFQKVEAQIDPNCWLFTFKTKKQKGLLQTLNKNGLQSRPFWVPMNQLTMFEKEQYITNSDRSNLIYHDCLSIPCSTGIGNHEIEHVLDVISKFYLN